MMAGMTTMYNCGSSLGFGIQNFGNGRRVRIVLVPIRTSDRFAVSRGFSK
ncbi:hypothetical protein OESDEN_21939 [Oesophagostomum dentatum]|uniref:Uncharacterized protein n=1 Tax=Oesophagostomum dentatum TaxID=61180 RepID=A0A0B1S5C5_OESDE|nr:hypothetical protein OESDEN_21939 [Oesophagostomum dentatum]